MEKQTKILLGLGLAGLAAYFILKPKKEVSTIVEKKESKKLDIDSLERVPSADDTPEMSLGATRLTYKDKNGVIYKYFYTTSYPPHGTYTDTNGNKWDDNGNKISQPLSVESISDSTNRCPNGYKLTPKPMGLTSMLVCEDVSGNITKPCREGESYSRWGNIDMGCSPMLELH